MRSTLVLVEVLHLFLFYSPYTVVSSADSGNKDSNSPGSNHGTRSAIGKSVWNGNSGGNWNSNGGNWNSNGNWNNNGQMSNHREQYRCNVCDLQWNKQQSSCSLADFVSKNITAIKDQYAEASYKLVGFGLQCNQCYSENVDKFMVPGQNYQNSHQYTEPVFYQDSEFYCMSCMTKGDSNPCSAQCQKCKMIKRRGMGCTAQWCSDNSGNNPNGGNWNPNGGWNPNNGGWGPNNNQNGGGWGPNNNQNGGGWGPNHNQNGGGWGPNNQGGGWGPNNNQNGGGWGPNHNQNGGGWGPNNQGGGWGPNNNQNSGGWGPNHNQNDGGWGPNNQGGGWGPNNNQPGGGWGPNNQPGGGWGPYQQSKGSWTKNDHKSATTVN